MKYLIITSFLLLSLPGTAQMTEPAHGGSTKAMVGEKIGITDVTINYGRPAVRGREGKIWGDVVFKGFQEESFGGGEPIPWRAGANESTTIEFSTDVFVEGRKIPAGKYGFFVAYDPKECTLIFSNINDSWGSYFYSDKEDVARVKVKPVSLKESIERLTYSFQNQTDSSAVISLAWEKLSIPFKVSVELHKLQMAAFQKELKSSKGFETDAWLQYANYLKDHNTNLDEALRYASNASRSAPSFRSFIAKAEILYMQNKEKAADSAVDKAIYYGNPYQLHYYALGKLNKKEHQRAMNLFRKNYEQNRDLYITNLGIVKGYQAMGNTSAALEAARKALGVAKDEKSRKEMDDLIKELEKKG